MGLLEVDYRTPLPLPSEESRSITLTDQGSHAGNVPVLLLSERWIPLSVTVIETNGKGSSRMEIDPW